MRRLVLSVPVVAVALIGACSDLKTAPVVPDASAGAAEADAGVEADATAADIGFTIVRDRSDAGAFRTVWVGGPDTVYVAGDDGVLLEKKGNDWAQVVLGPGFDVASVWGSGPDEALAVGTTKNTNSGPIFRRIGGTWVQIGTAPHGLRSVWGSGNVRYAVGNDGVVYSGPPSSPLQNGIQVDPNDQVAKTLFAPILFSVGGNDVKNVMVAADYDTTLFFDGTWHTYADPIDRTRSFRAIWGPPGATTDVYQGANYYGLWHFTGSKNPVLQLNEEKDDPANANRWIWGIWGPTADTIIAVGDFGRIMTYDRRTGEVKKRSSPTTRNLYAVGGTSLDDVWIVGEGQLVLHGRVDF